MTPVPAVPLVLLLQLFLRLEIAAASFFGLGPSAVPSSQVPKEQFKIYWNVPTFMCHKHGLHFEEVSRDFNILQNRDDEFRGDQIAILYDPGMFPAILKDPTGREVLRNGGVPQEGNLTKHLEVFNQHLDTQIPDQSFSGLAVIDFESWRPIFRQNWASLTPYKDLSIRLVRQQHPLWSKKSVQQEATRRFEKYGRFFMEQTLAFAKRRRPLASWGYYAYPYCFNLTPNQPSSQCDSTAVQENDKLTWLFDRQDLLLPSVYLRENLSANERVGLVNGRVNEASRIARKTSRPFRILPYYWYKYQDQRETYLSSTDLERTAREISDLGADGLIIWGSSDDINTKEKCLRLREYLTDVLGPILSRIARPPINGTPSTTSTSTSTSTTENDLAENQILQ